MAVKFFSFLTVVFVSLLLIGLVLPGTWEVERSRSTCPRRRKMSSPT